MVAMVLLIAARPLAGVEQYPRGLMPPRHRQAQSCTIETRPISFGYYDPLADRDVDAIGQVVYTCSRAAGRGPRVARTKASASRWRRAPRTHSLPGGCMGGVVRRFDYNIYLDATHRQVWGTGEGPHWSMSIRTPRTGHR